MQRHDALLCRIDSALGEVVRLLGGVALQPYPPLAGGVFEDLLE